MIGLFFMAYLVSRMVLEAYPYQAHWLAIPIGLAGTFLGIPLGWLWYRWRGDII
jgi:ABC-type branched-subunit amino acid transport system permease subunit